MMMNDPWFVTKIRRHDLTIIYSYCLTLSIIVLIIVNFGTRARSSSVLPEAPSLSKVLYCFWTGNNPMSDERRNCLNTLQNSGLEVKIITTENLSLFVLPTAPLHQGFPFLSETHKADYLRTYFMHFYGGGYTDIKNTTRSWLSAWAELNNDPSKYANGYTELGPDKVAVVPNARMNRIIHKNWFHLIGNCNYIMKPQTPFTFDWYTQMMKVMDKKLPLLRRYPARHPQEAGSQDYNYPISWTELLGDFFHPLCYKYRRQILHTCPSFTRSKYK